MNGSFVSDDLKDRRNDVVWRLRWRGGVGDDWFYLYLLLEFQSAPEPFMAVRLLVYVGLLLQELIRTPRAEGLPTGCRPSCRSSSTTASGRGERLSICSAFSRRFQRRLRRRLPRLEYVLVDEDCLTREEREQTGNLVSALARLETSRDAEELARSARELAVLLAERGSRSELAANFYRLGVAGATAYSPRRYNPRGRGSGGGPYAGRENERLGAQSSERRAQGRP